MIEKENIDYKRDKYTISIRKCDSINYIRIVTFLNIPLSLARKAEEKIRKIDTSKELKGYLIFNRYENGKMTFMCATDDKNKNKRIDEAVASLDSIIKMVEVTIYE